MTPRPPETIEDFQKMADFAAAALELNLGDRTRLEQLLTTTAAMGLVPTDAGVADMKTWLEMQRIAAPPLDWTRAEHHLVTMEKACRDLAGMPGVNMMFYQAHVKAFRVRFDAGERSEELYEEIMSLD